MGEDVAIAQSVSKKRSMLTATKDEDPNKSAHITNSSASGIPTDQSFMTVIQQAGMGGAKNSESVAHFDEIITNFVSKQVRRLCHGLTTQYHQTTSNDHTGLPDLTPTATDAFAAVVMVDVSGYSKLTAALAERGPVGAELLSKTMKGYLDQIIEVIVRNGGDIVKFAGAR
jgi:TFIIF-interacting CTD phosphatase-like protein